MDLDGDGRNEMYLKILMHGGEIIQAALGPIRVEQNFNRPNDGIVKSNSADGDDFPGTASGGCPGGFRPRWGRSSPTRTNR